MTDKLIGPRGTPKRDEWDAKQREKAIAAKAEIESHPAIVRATEQEAVRLAQKKAIQEAFVKAHKEKSKK